MARVAPQINVSLMAPEHIEFWDWVDALEPGVRPSALLLDWPRIFGKTTNARLGVGRMAVTMKRRFGLYVCATQTVANNHITSIRRRFEDLGIERREDKYGYSLGWNCERLRTANGFSLIALGADQASARGINLDDLRPDLLFFDDIDSLYDSPEAVDKKYGTITQTIIPAGATDCAILFAQNEIHGNSVMHRFVSGEADALRRRKISKVVAVNGLKIGREPSGKVGVPDQLRIIEGESTWAGRSLKEWEDLLNDLGEMPFRRECQHELGAGGLYFRFEPTKNDRPWHVCPMPTIERWWDAWGSHDYGESVAADAAACSHVAVADKWGVVTVVAEVCANNRTSKQQALALLLTLWEMGMGDKPPAAWDASEPGGVTYTDEDGRERELTTRLEFIAFDYANTFIPQGQGVETARQRMGEYPVEVWGRYGLPAIRATKDVIAGLRNLESWLARTVTYPADHPTQPGETVPAFRLAEGAAPVFEAALRKAIKDPKDERYAIVPKRLSHALDSGRYLLHTRPDQSKPPQKPLSEYDEYEVEAMKAAARRGRRR